MKSKSRLNSGNAYYHSVQNLLSSCLISKNLKIKLHETVILPVVLYGCKTWSFTFRNTDRRFLRTERKEDGSWRKLHNDELHSLYSSPNIVRVIKSRGMRWAGHVARMGVLVGRPEGKRPLGKPRRRWEDNIKLDLREIGFDGANWMRLT
jgi:hypothetical protein